MIPSHLRQIDQLVREMSYLDDPDRLVRVFGTMTRDLYRHDGIVTVSRRDLDPPQYRLTRSWRWASAADPWTAPHLFPLFDRGLAGELLYIGRPALLNRLRLDADDPTREHFDGMGALIAAPSYEHGTPVSMVFALRREPDSFTAADVETLLLNANLLGLAAVTMTLAGQLQQAYRQLDHEMEQVGRMQRHLLPAELPRPDGLELAAVYETCQKAGGDYYDVLELTEGRWGLFVADVSGHGTPAAVVMTMLRTLLKAYPGVPAEPAEVLAHLNRHLLTMAPEGMFATAFYGVYAAQARRLRYASAGHPPGLLRTGRQSVAPLPPTDGLPLGILPEDTWTEAEVALRPGDALLLYTDGVSDGMNAERASFGRERLDEALRFGPPRAADLVQHLDRRYRDFCGAVPAVDDRTLLAAVAVP